SGAAGPHPERLVLLRDALGILSVMCCLDDGLVFDPGFQRDYRGESAALEGLSESRVTAPLSYVVDAAGRIVAVVRRHVEGVLLSDVLERMARGLDVQTAATVVKDILTALAALHARGVAHRSIDPLHVIVEPHGGSVLIDPGLRPRSAEQSPGPGFVGDLVSVPELFAACVTTGRLLPGPDAQRYFAAGELEGVSRDLCLVLDQARRTTPERWREGTAAGAMLAALNAAASDCFDAGWDDRGRERLASAAAQTPYPARGRYFDFVPFAERGGRARSRRVRRPGVPSAGAKALGRDLAALDPTASNAKTENPAAPNPATANPSAPTPVTSDAAGTGTVTVWSTEPDSSTQKPGGIEADAARTPPSRLNRDRGVSQAWQAALANASRLASEWLGDNWRNGAGTVRAPVSGSEPKRPARRKAWRRLRILISRIAVPLIAFLVALVLSRIFLGGTVASQTNHHGSPAPARSPITSSAPVAAQPSPPSASPSPSATTASAPPLAVRPAIAAQSPAVTAVTSVSITALADVPGASGEANVTVAVRASGTGTVNVAIKLTEPMGAYGSQFTLTHTDHFTESGQRAYTITDTLPVASYCSRFGAAQAATVDVTAAAAGSADAPLTASGQLWTVRC
ncbi:MAG TPA: hypothetical protein VKV34_05535, partial [Thermoleophilia bacterium]|nr:hypothetical protein [Thermoleophilia bacterium]